MAKIKIGCANQTKVFFGTPDAVRYHWTYCRQIKKN